MSLVRTVRSVARSHGSVLWVVLMTGQRGTSSITLRCFVPLSVHLASHMYGWTLVLSLSVMLLLPAVYCRRYGMQRVVYAALFTYGDGAGVCSSFAFKVIHTKTALFFRHTPKMTLSNCYNKWSVGYFELKLHRHILGTPKTITSCKKWHNRCPISDSSIFWLQGFQ